jgi:hypothetical protein
MKCNVGNADRAIRIIAGLVLIGLAATGTIGMWGWIGIVPSIDWRISFLPGLSALGYQYQ